VNYFVPANANLAFHNHHSITLITWFLDICANQYAMLDLMNMTDSEPYMDTNQLHVGDGKWLSISSVAHSIICISKHTLTLSNILHVPHIKKPLLFV
jgi:hypothetical protein